MNAQQAKATPVSNLTPQPVPGC